MKSIIKKKIPHFGPLKGANRLRKNEKYYNSSDSKFSYKNPSNLNVSSRKGRQIDQQREKI